MEITALGAATDGTTRAMAEMRDATETMAVELQAKMAQLVHGYEYLHELSAQVPASLRHMATSHTASLLDAVNGLGNDAQKVEEEAELEELPVLNRLRSELQSIAHERVVVDVLTRQTIKDAKHARSAPLARFDTTIDIPAYSGPPDAFGTAADASAPLKPTSSSHGAVSARAVNPGALLAPSMRQWPGRLPAQVARIKTTPTTAVPRTARRSGKANAAAAAAAGKHMQRLADSVIQQQHHFERNVLTSVKKIATEVKKQATAAAPAPPPAPETRSVRVQASFRPTVPPARAAATQPVVPPSNTVITPSAAATATPSATPALIPPSAPAPPMVTIAAPVATVQNTTTKRGTDATELPGRERLVVIDRSVLDRYKVLPVTAPSSSSSSSSSYATAAVAAADVSRLHGRSSAKSPIPAKGRQDATRRVGHGHVGGNEIAVELPEAPAPTHRMFVSPPRSPMRERPSGHPVHAPSSPLAGKAVRDAAAAAAMLRDHVDEGRSATRWMSAVAVVDPATLAADTQQGSDNNRVVGGSTNRHGATPSSEAARAEPANMHLEKEILGLLQTVVQSNSDVLKGNQALMTSFFNHQQQQVQQSQQQQQESRQPHHQHDSRHHHGHHQQHRGVRASADGHDGRIRHLQTSSEKETADHRGGSMPMPMQLQQWMRPTPSEARALTEDRVDVTDISNEMPEPVSSKESSAPAPAPVVALAPASEPAPAPLPLAPVPSAAMLPSSSTAPPNNLSPRPQEVGPSSSSAGRAMPLQYDVDDVHDGAVPRTSFGRVFVDHQLLAHAEAYGTAGRSTGVVVRRAAVGGQGLIHDDQDDGADDAGRAPSLPFMRQVVAAGALGDKQARRADDSGGGATAVEIAAHLAAALGALVHTSATSAVRHAQAMSNAVPTTQPPAEAKAIVESDNDNNKRVGDGGDGDDGDDGDDDDDDDGFEEVKASDDVHAEVGPGLDRRSGHLHAALQRDVEASRRFLRDLRQQHDVSSEGSLSLASSSADPRDYLWRVRRGAQEEHREHGEVWFDGDEGTQPHSVAVPSVYPPTTTTTTTGRMLLVSSVLGCPSTRAVNAIDARVLMGDTSFVPSPPLLPRLRPPTDEEVVVDERARFQQLVHDTAVSDDDDGYNDGDDTAEVVEVDMVEDEEVDDDYEPVGVPSGLQLLRRRASVA
jgi:hypothetical protein